MSPTVNSNAYIDEIIRAEKLPAGFVTTVETIYRPLAAALARRARGRQTPLLVGINGAQGTGKSTLTRFLVAILEREHGLPSASFSLDDIYLTRAERESLAQRVHPMLATRGVPGTHDIALGRRVIDELARAGTDDLTAIPVFDKSRDDRAPGEQWRQYRGRPAVVIIEGWCVGALPEPTEALATPLNALERDEDPDGTWRRYVNDQLDSVYRDFFDLLDVLVYIPVPRWELVYQWRALQERKLAERCREQDLDTSAVMSPEQVARFVQFYERVTRHTMDEMAARADYLLTMEEDHRISAISGLRDPVA